MADEGERYQKFSRRALLLAGLQGTGLLLLAGRLYYLAVDQGDIYQLRADQNRISFRLIAPERGKIKDRFGYEIADNKQDFRVFLVPEQTEDVSGTLERIKVLVPSLSDEKAARLKRKIQRQRGFVPVTVVEHLDWDTFSKVNVALPGLPGVIPAAGMTRSYPDREVFAHVVGYMGRPNEETIRLDPLYQLPGFQLGREGLESRFENHLRGSAGQRQIEINSVGREIRELPDRREARSGKDITTTLNKDLQYFTVDLMKEQSCGVVVLDAQNGDILTLASTPAFDPNDFTEGISIENWNALLADPRTPLLNKCTASQVPPGSTFKMIVALTALEEGIITPETSVYCNGRYPFGDNVFHCWKRGGHGRLAVIEALGQSCDTFFYKLAESLDVDKIAAMARRFGFGQKSSIDLEGIKSGLVPTKQWKNITFQKPWYRGETLNISIGQGALLATPLQLAVMTARLATGKMIEPRLVFDPPFNARDTEPVSFDLLDVDPFHLSLVRQGMAGVMARGGTAHDYKRPKTAPVLAGKTGTSQVRRITADERRAGVTKNEDLPWARRDHSLFVGYTQVGNPEFAVAVLVEHGGGGSKVAAPLGRAILDEAVRLRALSAGSPDTDDPKSYFLTKGV